ncbi:uncharacterized protein LY89DRAFT_728223 [Mollisia scopiformis]|uniref:Rhodopsin domain-containing protein n=1 Tax=Mollisia scopiformis TaxID=149040 RepID=A0A194XTE5_MOLSC|nr:uncharacterized protein LY89DRAFT_728223 [Mollisia scopiformis]KUJ23478.1 hypothetical protein LY89DRAFT_728223 [Mollisia scopiformis]
MAYDLSVATARNPLIAITVFVAIAIATTALRFEARRMRKVPLAADDYLLLAALFCLFISVGDQYACVIAGGVGRHTVDVDPLDVVKTLKLILPFEALYGITLCLIKSSIICFYFRIFGNTRSFRISAYVVLAFIVCWALSVVLETFLLCRPVAYNWDTSIKGTCGDRNTVYVSAGALNVITDFMVMSLPVPHILTLQLKMKKKLGLLLMFSLGLFITIISIIRIKSLQVISFTDPTYTLPMGLLWTTLEPCLCIINANLPMVRTCLATYAPKAFGSTNDQTSRKTPLPGQSGSRSDPFDLIRDDRFGATDIKLGQIGTESRIHAGRRSQPLGDSDSERYLTKGDNHIHVGRSVDVESL